MGYLAGTSLPLKPLATRIAKQKTHGIVGHIDNIITRPKNPTDTKHIIRNPVDAYEKYYKSKPNCQGICAAVVVPRGREPAEWYRDNLDFEIRGEVDGHWLSF